MENEYEEMNDDIDELDNEEQLEQLSEPISTQELSAAPSTNGNFNNQTPSKAPTTFGSVKSSIKSKFNNLLNKFDQQRLNRAAQYNERIESQLSKSPAMLESEDEQSTPTGGRPLPDTAQKTNLIAEGIKGSTKLIRSATANRRSQTQKRSSDELQKAKAYADQIQSQIERSKQQLHSEIEQGMAKIKQNAEAANSARNAKLEKHKADMFTKQQEKEKFF